MKYVEMTVDEAKKLGMEKVLVAVTDLENDTEIQDFVPNSYEEFMNILDETETIYRHCDEFMSVLRAFTYKQPDYYNLINKGEMRTILVPRTKSDNMD